MSSAVYELGPVKPESNNEVKEKRAGSPDADSGTHNPGYVRSTPEVG